jgi:hypothetical protein
VVREENSGRPLVALLVQAYDKDVVFDDFLGSDHTGPDGRFEIQFTSLDFQDVVEQRPDVYLRIFDPTGKRELLSTIRDVRRNARSEEHFELTIPAGKVQESGRLA